MIETKAIKTQNFRHELEIKASPLEPQSDLSSQDTISPIDLNAVSATVDTDEFSADPKSGVRIGASAKADGLPAQSGEGVKQKPAKPKPAKQKPAKKKAIKPAKLVKVKAAK